MSHALSEDPAVEILESSKQSSSREEPCCATVKDSVCSFLFSSNLMTLREEWPQNSGLITVPSNASISPQSSPKPIPRNEQLAPLNPPSSGVSNSRHDEPDESSPDSPFQLTPSTSTTAPSILESSSNPNEALKTGDSHSNPTNLQLLSPTTSSSTAAAIATDSPSSSSSLSYSSTSTSSQYGSTRSSPKSPISKLPDSSASASALSSSSSSSSSSTITSPPPKAPSPYRPELKKSTSILYDFRPKKLIESQSNDWFQVDKTRNASNDEVEKVLSLSLSEKQALVGWQIQILPEVDPSKETLRANETRSPNSNPNANAKSKSPARNASSSNSLITPGVYVISGVRKARTKPTEYHLLSDTITFDIWTPLKRNKAKSGCNFKLLRKVVL